VKLNGAIQNWSNGAYASGSNVPAMKAVESFNLVEEFMGSYKISRD